ncbi:TPA: hypothetical protein HA246_06340 [Candidatus Woesearchaeota archaeon]|nr:hypothetical protein [Candidatus Woesearchaeota archaeon]
MAEQQIQENSVREKSNLHKAMIRLIPILKLLKDVNENGVVKIEEFNEQLKDNRILAKSQKWKIVFLLLVIKKQLAENPEEFVKQKEMHIAELEKLGKKEIADAVRNIEISNPELLNLLRELLQVTAYFNRQYEKSQIGEKQILAARFNARLKQDMEKANAAGAKSKNEEEVKKEASEIMQRLGARAEAGELRHLIGYYEDLGDLKERAQRGGLKIEDVVSRFKEYENGNGRAVTRKNIPIRGLVSAFNDKKLKKELAENDLIRNLLTFKQQEEFIKEIKQLLDKVLESDDWVGEFTTPRGETVRMPFIKLRKDQPSGFYDNLDKGHNFIRRIRVDFGNHKFAEELKTVKKNAKEFPPAFKAEFDSMYKRLHDNPRYRIDVMMAAINQLDSVFIDRMKELEKEQQAMLAQEERNIADLIRKLQAGIKAAIDNFVKVIGKQTQTAEDEWKELKSRYEQQVKDFVLELDKILLDAETMRDRLGLKELDDIFSASLEQEQVLTNAIRTQSQRIASDRIDPDHLPQLYMDMLPMTYVHSRINEVHAAREEIRLVADERAGKSFGVIKDMTARGQELIREYREMIGTIEMIHQRLGIKAESKIADEIAKERIAQSANEQTKPEYN